MIRKYLTPTLLVVLFGAMMLQLPMAIAARAADYEWFDPIVIIRAILLEDFVHEPTAAQLERMQTQMINSMITELDDPYTEYVPARDLAAFDKSLRGEYVGIGAEVNIENDYLIIVSPMDGSPALEAGIMAGDTVLEIEGESTYQMPIDAAIDRLMGEPGTNVSIRVMHANGEEEDVVVTRRRIVAQTVRGAYRKGQDWVYEIDPESGIGYIRITQFNSTTVDGMQQALANLLQNGPKGLILDVRFDPGGELEGALALADMFLDSGVIVSVRGRSRPEQSYEASPGGTFPDVPIIVMVNEGSASASEILAGALQENGRAVVLGERSFGKGSVQEVRPLPDNMGTLKLTTAHYFLPSGRHISRHSDSVDWGVDPNDGFYVEMSNDEYRDMNIAKRDYEAIREGEFDGTAEWSNPDWIQSVLKDRQLAAAVKAMHAKLQTGEWQPVGASSTEGTAITAEVTQMIELRSRLVQQLARTDQRIEELAEMADDEGRPRLLPEGALLDGGTLTVTDESGTVIGSFRILDDDDLELALEYAGVERLN